MSEAFNHLNRLAATTFFANDSNSLALTMIGSRGHGSFYPKASILIDVEGVDKKAEVASIILIVEDGDTLKINVETNTRNKYEKPANGSSFLSPQSRITNHMNVFPKAKVVYLVSESTSIDSMNVCINRSDYNKFLTYQAAIQCFYVYWFSCHILQCLLCR